MPADALTIVADRNVAGIEEAAPTLAPRVALRLLSSAEIDAAAVREADLLFVRSTVRCGEALLSGSRVRFVGTATIGTDHLDLPYLERAGVAWASAPGCNADAVVQWLAAAVLHLTEGGGLRRPASTQGPPLAGLVAGVVGLGNVGGRAARLLSSLGAEVLVCDPPRARAGLPGGPYRSLEALCDGADLLTLHVPLTREGEDRTVDLIDRRRLRLLRRDAVLVNSCRGEVVAEEVLREPEGRTLVCDVLPGEPAVDPVHVGACAICTPHVAGHSLEGKLQGTVQVYEAACRFLGVPARWRPGPAWLPTNPFDGLAVRSAGRSALEVLTGIVRRSYDIGADDLAQRRIAALPERERGAAFRSYREGYPPRRQLTGAGIRLDRPPERWVCRTMEALGARCDQAPVT